MEAIESKISTSDRLYSVMADRLEQQGESLPCTMDALRVYATEPRADIDYLDLINLDNRSLFDVCYIVAFNTFPPPHYLEQWQDDIENLPKEEFHRKFMNSFVYLGIFSTHQVRLRNCIYLDAPLSQGRSMEVPAKLRPGFGVRFRAWLYTKLHPLYAKLPVSIKKKLKDLLWNKFFIR